MPKMSDKKFFRQIYNFYKKLNSNLQPEMLHETNSKKNGLGSLGTKLLGDARFQVLSMRINLC